MKKNFLAIGLIFSSVYADITLCNKNNTVVFSCDIKKKKLSICKQDNKRIVYKYGMSNKIELEIKSKPKFSSVQFIRPSYENHLRFHNKGYDYIVYDNELYEYDKDPNDGTAHYKEHYGVYVVKNEKLLAKLSCSKIYKHMIGIGNVSKDVMSEKYIGY